MKDDLVEFLQIMASLWEPLKVDDLKRLRTEPRISYLDEIQLNQKQTTIYL